MTEITEERRQELFDAFLEASINLSNEITEKKFDPSKRKAYLSCFLSIENIMQFRDALETFLEECGE